MGLRSSSSEETNDFNGETYLLEERIIGGFALIKV